MSDITIPVNSGDLPVFTAVPEQRAPWSGVVVLHDIGGLKEGIRNQARWLALAGFLAAAPNLYFCGPMMKCVFAIARPLKARRGQPTTTWRLSARGWFAMNRGVAQRLEQPLTTACITHDVKEYPDAGHSFLNLPHHGGSKPCE